jgi:membrane dipeptidase
MKKFAVGFVVLLVAALVSFFTIVPVVVDARMNTVVSTSIPAVSPQAWALHRTLFVADLHADELLWGRDLLQRVDRGHVDLPRLQEGKVAPRIRPSGCRTRFFGPGVRSRS